MTIELLETNKLCERIHPKNRSYLAQLEIFETIDSTNSYLLAQAKAGAPSGSVCFAEMQTQGRGRLGREWFSPASGNLYVSLLWRFADLSIDLSGLSIAVAVMVTRALREYGVTGIQLKWPNDIWVANRKLAGILLERNDPLSIVTGIGLNLNVQEAREKSWIDIAEITGQVVRRNDLAGLLLNELLGQIPQYTQTGLSSFIKDWRQHDILFNQPITIHTPIKKIPGMMRGISDTGELLLEDESTKIQRFCYGEVSIRSE